MRSLSPSGISAPVAIAPCARAQPDPAKPCCGCAPKERAARFDPVCCSPGRNRSNGKARWCTNHRSSRMGVWRGGPGDHPSRPAGRPVLRTPLLVLPRGGPHGGDFRSSGDCRNFARGTGIAAERAYYHGVLQVPFHRRAGRCERAGSLGHATRHTMRAVPWSGSAAYRVSAVECCVSRSTGRAD